MTHTEGRYFEHDLERMDIESARHCRYRLTEDRPCSPAAQTAVSSIKLGWPSVEFYFCVLCYESYLGRKICPKCGEHIYTTEVKLRDPTWTLEK
ncbi:putative zinc ribbon protein [Serratia sp. Ag1]|uniref:putative zinc ribbon protein n=1 Tax=unclassified Serratia (in: enterobacteria) TaxID=2647522 RepID=UPI001377AD36